MIRTLPAFVTQTFREAIRNKILYGIGFFSLAILLFSLVLGELSLYEQVRVIRDVGITFIGLMGIGLAIYTGVGMLHKEVDRRTIYTILSKPVRRYEVILGKFMGIAVTLFVELLAMFLVFLALLLVRDIPIDAVLFQAFWLAYVKALVVAAAALMFSTFSGAMLSTLMSASLFVLGSLYSQISLYAERNDTLWVRAAMRSGQFLLPDLGHFDLSTHVSYSLHVDWSHVGWASLHGLFYVVVLLCIGAIVFERRDFI
ncbi:MAG: ABC transporter permease [Proteobacteria bacterium]|nr:ABC transporter permease [Pseudomonadota bacterium]